MINSRQPPGQMIRLLIRRRHRHPESNILRRSRHSRDDSQRLVHRPLRPRDDSRVEVPGPLVYVVSAQDVGDEDPVEFRRLEKLRELNPVVDVVEPVGLVFGMCPETGRLVAAAYSIPLQLLNRF